MTLMRKVLIEEREIWEKRKCESAWWGKAPEVRTTVGLAE
jgi:hypothetical protein